MENSSSLIILSILNITLFYLSYLVGKVFFWFFSKKKQIDFFEVNFGFVFIVCLAATFYTSFSSILFWMLLYMSLLFLSINKPLGISLNRSFKLNAVFFADVFITTVVSSIFLYFFYDFNEEKTLVIGHDYSQYASISYYMAEFGVENRYAALNNYQPFISISEPYHYIELWLIALVSKLSNINNLYVCHGFSFMFSITMFFLGAKHYLLKFYKRIENKQLLYVILIGLIPSTPFVCFYLLKDIPLFDSVNYLGQSFWLFSKYQPYLGFFIFFLIAIRENFHKGLYVLTIFPFFHIGFSPVLLVFYFLIFLFEIYKNRNSIDSILNSFKSIIPSFLLLITVIGFIFAYYSFKGSGSKLSSSANLSMLLDPEYIKLLIRIFTKTSLDLLFTFSPIILLVIYWSKFSLSRIVKLFNQEYIFSTVALIFSGLISYVIFNHSSREAYQFLYLILFSIGMFFFITIPIIVLYVKPTRFKALFLILFIMHAQIMLWKTSNKYINESVENSWINKMSDFFNKHDLINTVGGTFIKPDIKNYRILGLMQTYKPIVHAHPSLFAIQANPLDVPKEGGIWVEVYKGQKRLPVNKFLENSDNNQVGTLKYFKEYDIRWVIKDRYTYMPEYLQKYVTDSIHNESDRCTIYNIKL